LETIHEEDESMAAQEGDDNADAHDNDSSTTHQPATSSVSSSVPPLRFFQYMYSFFRRRDPTYLFSKYFSTIDSNSRCTVSLDYSEMPTEITMPVDKFHQFMLDCIKTACPDLYINFLPKMILIPKKDSNVLLDVTRFRYVTTLRPSRAWYRRTL
jgi:hypothetical protein